ncbi:DNA polymerase III subunit delta [bacterium (Candidatus Blackallbacteria) CG17_big_fil_post_rev_8_21_14_2_50_48_46]|uniref:DNA polymerase III subunit delta n=1 Tax=bacterium (Candidatus Blackallbacteria) CG17_big_fil_post_rev_8_21_14_2_50_48_46 TaxID=2014261 RepID=A0A2M7FX50_9BACT|nr:MAG: DNA polymerase III subunit delta [bacterium (Candidatus Blackallbacteria) CG18_big_fil_WC_8_21_14_2_50_49_26]PIW13821.1 MAG: DNA polymerase III subunit delta [bacterium (Candidatus Blackallbacteria) CG17_big_fil_post_rev_8_21_14_2_50_48_46]PIW45047.1 MAG: DNA polymerase III subunit delta [bacterium (Candidatus Blackallbacteria) CG13_big_fil_rev_8_21_14_2_50_49_14]
MSSAGIYLLTGEDHWQRQKYFQGLLERHLEPEWRDLNLERFNGDDTEPSVLLESWLTPPFWGECRILLIEFQRSPEALNTLMGFLLAYFESHQPETPNLMVIMSEGLDKRRKEAKNLLKQIQHLDFPAIKSWNIEKELYPWIEEELRKAGKRITRPALQYLGQALGVDKFALHQTLDKLLTYLGEETLLEETQVRVLVAQTEADVFSLLDMLARRREDLAQNHLQHQLLRESPEALMASLAANLRSLYRARSLQAQKWGLEEIAKELGQHSFRLKKNLELWQGYTLSELDLKVRRLLELQTRMRQGLRLDPALALEIWIHEFIQAVA